VGRLAMEPEELDDFLAGERVLRLATLDEDGWPAVVPVWYVWHDGAFWVWNLTRARRTVQLERGTRCGFVVDAGDDYVELRGASGRCTGARVPDDEVPLEVRVGFSRRYLGSEQPLEPAHHHAWFRFVPDRVASWDFRKQFAS
jgi:hypothetical protein